MCVPAEGPGLVGDELQTQMVGISTAGWGQISSLPCLSSPAPTPTETPEDRVPVTLLTLAGLVFMEAGHGAYQLSLHH